MRSFLLFILLTPFLAWSQNSMDSTFKVKIIFDSFTQGGEVEFEYFNTKRGKYTDLTKQLDSSIKQLVFSGYISEPWEASITLTSYSDLLNSEIIQQYNFILLPGITTINFNKSFKNAKAVGNPYLRIYQSLLDKEKIYDVKSDSLVWILMNAKRNRDSVKENEITKQLLRLKSLKCDSVYLGYYINNPYSKIAPFIFDKAIPATDLDPYRYLKLLEKMPHNVQIAPSVARLRILLNAKKQQSLGLLIKDIPMLDTGNKVVRISEFKGKYLLVDFWASWCIPCRKENPTLVDAYDKYSKKGFHIISVALERRGEKENWINAIVKDNLHWTNVTDFNYWDNELSKSLGINFIPYNILLDPNGRIIAKNLHGNDLLDTIEQLLK